MGDEENMRNVVAKFISRSFIFKDVLLKGEYSGDI